MEEIFVWVALSWRKMIKLKTKNIERDVQNENSPIKSYVVFRSRCRPRALPLTTPMFNNVSHSFRVNTKSYGAPAHKNLNKEGKMKNRGWVSILMFKINTIHNQHNPHNQHATQFPVLFKICSNSSWLGSLALVHCNHCCCCSSRFPFIRWNTSFACMVVDAAFRSRRRPPFTPFPPSPENQIKSKKTWVLIILVIVFKHN